MYSVKGTQKPVSRKAEAAWCRIHRVLIPSMTRKDRASGAGDGDRLDRIVLGEFNLSSLRTLSHLYHLFPVAMAILYFSSPLTPLLSMGSRITRKGISNLMSRFFLRSFISYTLFVNYERIIQHENFEIDFFYR